MNPEWMADIALDALLKNAEEYLRGGNINSLNRAASWVETLPYLRDRLTKQDTGGAYEPG